MNFLLYPILAIGGYLMGSSNLAYFLARGRGFDIRTLGSNNAGASNAVVTMGFRTGVMVAVHDVLKSCFAALMAALIFPNLPNAGAVAGVAAVLGHIFPFYLRFRGGKGFASFMGLILALDWRFFLVIGAMAVLITVISDYIVLGTFTTILCFPLYLLLWKAALLCSAIVAVASLVIFLKHIVNIGKLRRGEEIGLRQALSRKR